MTREILAFFHRHGLQAMQLQTTADKLEILIGDISSSPQWSCIVEIMSLNGVSGQLTESKVFCRALEGPNKDRSFALDKLLADGTLSAWQLLRGQKLPDASRIKTARMRAVLGEKLGGV